jgi:pimeloyl-ACP methyl ester carboxylesterase
VAAAAGWIAYSALIVNHRRELPPALPGKMFAIDTPAGNVNMYADGPDDGVPLLLVHSINAAASAYEVRPLYLHYRSVRRVYALDLPGFGFSERENRTYTPRLMADAIHAAVAAIRARHGNQKVDVIALSLSCEYAARAALERPGEYRSLGFVSPTGFDSALSGNGPDQSTRGSELVLSAVSVPLWSQAAYDLLVSRPSMRQFLRKTWGSREIDEGLFAYDQLTAHQPGAQYVVWSFLAGFLFADDISRLYQQLTLPVWAVHGTRGDFVDFRRERDVANKPNWTFDVFDTGAFPHFERLAAVARSYDAFLSRYRGLTQDIRTPRQTGWRAESLSAEV